MQFKLNTLKTQSKNKFQPQEQIIEYVRCNKCNTRDTSRLSVGFTLVGLQVWCDTCDISIAHLRLNTGEYVIDKYPQGNFNKRNLREGQKRMNKYSITSMDLLKKKQEEEENDFGYDHDIRHNAAYNS